MKSPVYIHIGSIISHYKDLSSTTSISWFMSLVFFFERREDLASSFWWLDELMEDLWENLIDVAFKFPT